MVLSLDKDGGLEKVLVDALLRFDPRSVASQVYCVEERGDLASRVETAGIPVSVVCKRGRADLSVPWRLSRRFRAEGIDIIHSYSGVYRDGTVAGLLGRIAIQIHTDQGALYPDTWKKRWTHRTFTLGRDRVVAVSKDLKHYLVAQVGLPADKIVIIRNAVDPSMYNGGGRVPVSREALGVPVGVPCIGIVARLVPVKDHHTLLRAAARVSEKVQEFCLLVVGDGPLRGELETLACELGIADRTRFLGHRTDVPVILPCLDLFILSSRHEGTSLTLLEAMASGKAVVATNVGGTPELVEHGRTGLLVPPARPDLLADAILSLLQDPRLRDQMGKAGQARVYECFNINAMVEAYTKLYETLAKGKNIH